MMDKFKDLVERMRPMLVGRVVKNGVTDAEELVADALIALSEDLSWMEGHGDEELAAFVHQRITWKISDWLRKKKGLEEIALHDLHEEHFATNAWKGLTEQIDDGTFRDLLERLLSYRGPAPTWSRAVRWHLPKRHEPQLKLFLAKLQGFENERIKDLAREILLDDLCRVANNIVPQKGRKKLEYILGIHPISERDDVSPVIEAAANTLIQDFVKWANKPEQFVYEDFFAPYRVIVEEQVSPLVTDLGDTVMTHREAALILSKIRGYLEGLQGKDQAKGKALLLHKFLGLSVEETANELFLSIEQTRGLVANTVAEIRALANG